MPSYLVDVNGGHPGWGDLGFGFILSTPENVEIEDLVTSGSESKETKVVVPRSETETNPGGAQNVSSRPVEENFQNHVVNLLVTHHYPDREEQKRDPPGNYYYGGHQHHHHDLHSLHSYPPSCCLKVVNPYILILVLGFIAGGTILLLEMSRNNLGRKRRSFRHAAAKTSSFLKGKNCFPSSRNNNNAASCNMYVI